jgi:TfoX/Sxy family transcriptional regulator of competence genes/GNAT superfamily N-acetyltransferase
MAEPELWDYLRESFEPLGVVRIRRMFGGAGVSIDGFNMGFVGSDVLYLKADAGNAAVFDAEGLEHLVYDKAGRLMAMSYRRAPDAAYDDPEIMREWGVLALAAAVRAKAPGKRGGLLRRGACRGVGLMLNAVMIRTATPADISTIRDMIVELAVYEREPDAVKASEADLHKALFGERPIAEAVIAEHDGTAVGVAVFFTNFSTWEGKGGLYLEDLFVRPQARGLGIGKALLVHLAGIAVARDYARFQWQVLDWNAPAIGFYEALGAKPMSEWVGMRVEGAALAALAGA